ncbi:MULTISPECIES: LCP family protein [Micromonospora]|uniref:LytR family transcriptional regulator n=1 Tax=Micromonospora solifontis TaxID=2487138 RepID=A0ABX9W8P0_9ACTN|nr:MULTISPECIES: LCP family protein [Micromonospora]NES16861.1 LCP family protein [Micromonospora sp. PPF5-17B]NES39815.1 LCP family protein [Micromonospora solifontis]NES58500.1 LCP family protein [Micromonospora sp. PPF5-6]RNL84895.1 LytR family transcriptional regulator [Micromonospora solifontis]
MSDRHQLADPDTHFPGSDVDPEVEAPAPKPRRRGRRIALIVLLVVVLLAGGGMLAGGLYYRSVNNSIERVDAFQGVPEESRPQVVAKGAMNIMILGSDSRDPESTGGSRSDTIILAHLPKDRSSAQLISIPRDTWVSVPRSKDGRHGGRDAKINAAYAWGGIPLMVQTVEQFTGVRIDHVTIVDFAGFKEIVDALGGINVDVEKKFTSIHPPFRAFSAGPQQMDGAAALDYSRQRKQFADGDFARIRHQQQVIRAILDKAASGGVLANPAKLNSFVKATSSAVAVDNSLSLLDLAMQMRGMRGSNLGFYTCPTKGTGRVGSESVVFADKAKAKGLFDAVRRDAVPEIVAAGK